MHTRLATVIMIDDRLQTCGRLGVGSACHRKTVSLEMSQDMYAGEDSHQCYYSVTVVIM